jgi:hypothetical protein
VTLDTLVELLADAVGHTAFAASRAMVAID